MTISSSVLLGILFTALAYLLAYHPPFEPSLKGEQVRGLYDKFLRICDELEDCGFVATIKREPGDYWKWCRIEATISVGAARLKFGFYYKYKKSDSQPQSAFKIWMPLAGQAEEDYRLFNEISKGFGLPRCESVSYFMEEDEKGIAGFLTRVAESLEKELRNHRKVVGFPAQSEFRQQAG